MWRAGGAEPSDALDWARNSVQAGSSVKFAGEDDVDAFGFEEVRRQARTQLTLSYCHRCLSPSQPIKSLRARFTHLY